MDEKYRLTINVAAPGTPLQQSTGTSSAGHVYYVVSDSKQLQSYGFAPIRHGEASGPGGVVKTDAGDYKDPYYSRTMEITKEQYDKLREFGESPAKYGFR